jgi:hypothetical protein
MNRASLAAKISWDLQAPWHLRQPRHVAELSVLDTVKGLQTWLLAQSGAALSDTLQQVYTFPVALEALQRLEIALYQEGIDQRVWRVQATLADGSVGRFGIIVARAPGISSTMTRRDFHHLHALYSAHARYCVRPYTTGMLPVAGGVAAHTVEWLEDYKELVFEVTLDGGVFLVNAHGAHRRFSPQTSRQIWRALGQILCWYPALRAVNIQAGDFVGRVDEAGHMALKLTTARELVATTTPVEHLQAMLACMITASGYLGDGYQPFDRAMPKTVFLPRMQTMLQRRFGSQARTMAEHQWALFQAGAFARQEDALKEECILALYDRLCADASPTRAWQETQWRWLAYAEAVHTGQCLPSWWFPAAEIPQVLEWLAPGVRHQQTTR